MTHKLLVTYATRFGSTQEVAAAITETLQTSGLEVELQPMQEIHSIDGFDAVLLGSAVNHARWLPEAVDFVKTHQAALKGVPVALFTVHITNLGKDANSRARRLAYLDKVRPLLGPVDVVFFPGRLDRRGAAELLPGWVARFLPKMDFRKWKKIRAWAEGLPQRLLAQG